MAQIGWCVRRDMRDPDRLLLRRELERRLFLLDIEMNCRKMLPGAAVIAEHRDNVRPHRAGARLVVIFADEIGERDGDLLSGDVIHAEVVPGGLAVSAALIFLADDVATESRVINSLDSAKRGVFEIQIESGVGGTSDRH